MSKLREINRYKIMPPDSINHHSVRILETQNEQRRFRLDRTTDGVPPFFHATECTEVEFPRFDPVVLVGGKQYWGDGLSWPEAIRELESAIAKAEGQVKQ